MEWKIQGQPDTNYTEADMVDKLDDKTRTEISIQSNKIRFVSRSERGEVTDSMLVPEGKKHADVSLHIDPKAFKDGYGAFVRMAFTDSAAIMQSDDKQHYYVVAALG